MNIIERECPRHGLTRFSVQTRRTICLKCNTAYTTKYRKQFKPKIHLELGNKCVICGYDKYIGALDFHHLDPSTKEFAIKSGNVASLRRIVAEAKKCILVCANCHREIEAGITEPTPKKEFLSC